MKFPGKKKEEKSAGQASDMPDAKKNQDRKQVKIDEGLLNKSPSGDEALRNVDKGLTLEEKSDEDYREVTKRVVDITEKNLNKQTEAKDNIRKELLPFIRWFLVLQYTVLCIILVFNDIILHLNTTIITTYIVSVFAETLAGLIIMIKYAFDPKQEVELLKVLNAVVSDYQKVKGTKKDEETTNQDK